MILRGAFTVFETTFALPSSGVDSYDFDTYAVNINILANACAALTPPVIGALSADIGRQAAPSANGDLRVGAGFGIIVSHPWYNAPLQSTEYYARQTCGHVQTPTQLGGSHAELSASGFKRVNERAPYIVVQGGVVCEDALQGMFAPGAGIPVTVVADNVPANLSGYSVVLVACDNLGGPQSGGTLTISGTTATFKYDKAVPIKPVLAVELMYTGASYSAAIITSVSLTEMLITFKDQNGTVVNFPGGRLGITGIMFVE